jgi:Protein of unknown function (DUF2380)
VAASFATSAIGASSADGQTRAGPALLRFERAEFGTSGAMAQRMAEVKQERASDEEPAAAIPIAVVDFDYQDTSGEPIDQAAEHRARMAAFMSKLRADLRAGGKYAPVAIACANPPCTAGNMAPAALIAAAKKAGARLLLYGEVQKMSTLIQWGKMEVVDLADDRLVGDKMLTFRGDTDEAWRRAEAFLVQELRGLNIAK